MASNLRSGQGEIDLLVVIGGRVVAVEVKSRIGEDPLIQLTSEKERRMREAAAAVRPRPWRIDVVAVRFDRSGITIRWVPGVV
ncbi:MAG: YraN family protein [Acidimicrobiia bacterium]|nr:YraN family protein [Acidimicrobiia bacterium]